jgi:hypothetical protein
VLRSNFLGLCRVLFCRDGDVGGSFFTTILGFPPLLLNMRKLVSSGRHITLTRGVKTYDLGDRLPSEGVLSFVFVPLFISGVTANSGFRALGVAVSEGASGG